MKGAHEARSQARVTVITGRREDMGEGHVQCSEWLQLNELAQKKGLRRYATPE